MKNVLWETIHRTYEQVLDLCNEAEAEIPETTGEEAGLQAAQESLVRLRTEIRTRLDGLRSELLKHLNERETYLVLFPLVVTFDEMVSTRFGVGTRFDWPPLQKELYDIGNGGEVFYSTIDDIVRKPDTLPVIFEVFFFCLSAGFKGRYEEDPTRLEAYREKLRDHIPVSRPPEVEAGPETRPVAATGSGGRRYYLGAGLVVFGVYVLLHAMSLS